MFGQVMDFFVQIVEKDGVWVDFFLKIGLQGVCVVLGVYDIFG